jgi:hypothetical protein
MKISRRQHADFGVVLSLALLIAGMVYDVAILYKVAAVLLFIVLLFPALFAPFSYLWYGLAGAMEKGVSRLVLAIVFYLVVTPVGVWRRWLGKDSLRLKGFGKGRDSVFASHHKTYTKEDLTKQF